MNQSLQIGKTLQNRYKILKFLGSGGFGNTYLAIDLHLPKQPQCVVKHLKPKNPNPAVLSIAKKLFEREAQTLYQLGNENSQIPKLFAHFEENEEFYLVQEFVDGHDLSKEIIPGKPLSEDVVFQLLRDILEVLSIVHQYKVIHRDIKPQNLMRRRKDGKIVLIDFGAVKEISAMSVNTQGQTNVTVAVGTPGYMASEQANGKPKLGSDVYAVGIIGIQALTGLMPQQLKQDSTTGEIIWRNFAQVSDKFAEVLDTMVRDHFSQRYHSDALALQALISTVVSLPPLIPSVMPPSPTIRQRLNSWLIVGFTLLLSLGGYVYWQFRFDETNSSKLSPPILSPSKTVSVENTSLVNTLIGHTDQVTSVAISPDGETLVSGSEDHTIKIWQMSTGTLVRTLMSNSGSVASVAISPNGQTLVSGGANAIEIWRLSTGTLVRTLTGHSRWIGSVAISPDGQTLVSSSWDNNIKIWNLTNGSLIRTIPNHSKQVFSVAISPNNQTLVSSSLDNTIKIWNLVNGSLKSSIPERSNYAYSVAISSNNQILVSGSADKTIKIWQLSSGQLLDTLTGHSKWVNSVALGLDAKTLASGSADKTIKIWQLSKQELK